MTIPPHHGTVYKLRKVGIPVGAHRDRQITRGEYESWDLIASMDRENERGLNRILDGAPNGACHKLLDCAGSNRDVAEGCSGLFEHVTGINAPLLPGIEAR